METKAPVGLPAEDLDPRFPLRHQDEVPEHGEREVARLFGTAIAGLGALRQHLHDDGGIQRNVRRARAPREVATDHCRVRVDEGGFGEAEAQVGAVHATGLAGERAIQECDEPRGELAVARRAAGHRHDLTLQIGVALEFLAWERQQLVRGHRAHFRVLHLLTIPRDALLGRSAHGEKLPPQSRHVHGTPAWRAAW